MNSSIRAVAMALLAATPLAYGGPAAEWTARPCVEVNVQNDRHNEANVQQHCDRNFNRTVQAGARNEAQTIQNGRINNNTVRQYSYEWPPEWRQRVR